MSIMTSPALQSKSIWSYNPLPTGCVLYLPFWHPNLSGPVFKSIDGGHTCTVTTATHTVDGRDFNSATPDYIELVSESVMNFISGAFSIVARIKLDALTAQSGVFCRGLYQTDGYGFTVLADGRLLASTWQVGANQDSYSTAGDVTTATWYTVGLSRSAGAIDTFVNGVDRTSISSDHTNPVTSARTAKIGIYDDKAGNPLDGKMKELIVYSKSLSSIEHLHIHNILSQR